MGLIDLIERFNEENSECKRETNEKESKIENKLAKPQGMKPTSLEAFCQKKFKNVEKVIQRIPRKGDGLLSHKIICHTFKKSQNFRILAAVRETGNKETRG